MKLLVLAQIPPPTHGQSLMVQTLLDALPVVAPDIELHHVNLPLSRNTADIGSWRLGKLLPLIGAIWQVWRLTLRHGRMTLYYVPAPGKRSALYRDLVLMFFCRPFATRLVLHWHATGLGGWLQRQARPFERKLARRALGRADISIVLGEALRADVSRLHPVRTIVVRNGIADPCGPQGPHRNRERTGPIHAVFLSQCSREKGVFVTLAGVAEFHRRSPGAVRLSVAGDFPDITTAAAFRTAAQRSGVPVDEVGFVTGDAKRQLLLSADVLIFPTRYAHETQGLVVVEALAHDIPVIVTRWSAVAEDLPASHSIIMDPTTKLAPQITAALETLLQHPPPPGEGRRYFLSHYTEERFAREIVDALR